MSGPTWLPAVIPVVALIALFGWLAAVYYSDGHPGWSGQRPVPGQRDAGAVGSSGPAPEIPRQAASPEAGAETGIQTGAAAASPSPGAGR